MNWTTGNWSSVPEDARAFLEKDSDAHWWVYETGMDGALLEGFPKLHPEFFYDLVSAQLWVESEVPPRNPHTLAKRLQQEGVQPVERLLRIKAAFGVSLAEAKAADWRMKIADLVDEDREIEEADRLDRLLQIQEDPDRAAHTIDRLRAERDKLRNEVMALRGHVAHDHKPDLDPAKLGQTMQFTCSRCGHVSSAPVHGYFDPCPGRRT